MLFFSPLVFKLEHAGQTERWAHLQSFWSVGLGWGLNICTSGQFRGRPTLRTAGLEMQLLL